MAVDQFQKRIKSNFAMTRKAFKAADRILRDGGDDTVAELLRGLAEELESTMQELLDERKASNQRRMFEVAGVRKNFAPIKKLVDELQAATSRMDKEYAYTK